MNKPTSAEPVPSDVEAMCKRLEYHSTPGGERAEAAAMLRSLDAERRTLRNVGVTMQEQVESLSTAPINLPPLPEGDVDVYVGHYSTDAMQSYARQAFEAGVAAQRKWEAESSAEPVAQTELIEETASEFPIEFREKVRDAMRNAWIGGYNECVDHPPATQPQEEVIAVHPDGTRTVKLRPVTQPQDIQAFVDALELPGHDTKTNISPDGPKHELWIAQKMRAFAAQAIKQYLLQQWAERRVYVEGK